MPASLFSIKILAIFFTNFVIFLNPKKQSRLISPFIGKIVRNLVMKGYRSTNEISLFSSSQYSNGNRRIEKIIVDNHRPDYHVVIFAT